MYYSEHALDLLENLSTIDNVYSVVWSVVVVLLYYNTTTVVVVVVVYVVLKYEVHVAALCILFLLYEYDIVSLVV